MPISNNMKLHGMVAARTEYLTRKSLAARRRVLDRFAGGHVALTHTAGNWAWKLLDKITAEAGLKAGDDVEKALGLPKG